MLNAFLANMPSADAETFPHLGQALLPPPPVRILSCGLLLVGGREAWLHADMQTSCTASPYLHLLRNTAIVMVVIYPVGIPCVIAARCARPLAPPRCSRWAAPLRRRPAVVRLWPQSKLRCLRASGSIRTDHAIRERYEVRTHQLAPLRFA